MLNEQNKLYEFLNENILPLLCEQIGTDDLQK